MVLAVGTGGVAELSAQLDDRTVSWALLRFQIGSGTFMRTKLVVLHCNGNAAPVMLRGWLNARSQEVLRLIGDVHATIEVQSASELSIDSVCERLLPLFNGDDLNYSAKDLHAEYEKMVQLLKQQEAEKAEKAKEKRRSCTDEGTGRRVSLPALEAVPEPVAEEVPEPPAAPLELAHVEEKEVLPEVTSAHEALQSVSADAGTFNWLLLEPVNLKLHRVGAGGLDDMKEHLANDKVLFGIIRLNFGTGRSAGGRSTGITKHVLVHWVGPAVSNVRRGVWNSKLKQAAAFLGGNCSVSFCRQALSAEDLHLDNLIKELRRYTVVEGLGAADGVAASRISSEEYRAALAEQERERRREEAEARSLRRLLVEEARLEKQKESEEELRARELALQEDEAERQRQQVVQEQLETERTRRESQVAAPDIRATVDTVRSASGGFNWVLLGWNKASGPVATPLPPSPCRARLSFSMA